MITDAQLIVFCEAVSQKKIQWLGSPATLKEYGNEGETALSYAQRVHGFQGVAYERGQKFARIVDKRSNGNSVLCFVDLENGNILKAAGWKAPEPKRHVRGNIANGAADLSHHGTAAYLR